MRSIFTCCMAVLVAHSAFAGDCGVAIGTYQFKAGDVESTSVVNGKDIQAVLSADASKVLQAMAKENEDPVLVRAGSFREQRPLKAILGLDPTAPKFLENAAITIPGNTTSDGLVLQQVFKTCL